MLKSGSTRLWVCSNCVRRATQAQRRWLSAIPSASSADSRILPAEHSPPGQGRDDEVLRQLFDSPGRGPSTWAPISSALRPSAGLFKNKYLTSPEGFLVFATRSLEKARTIVTRVLNASTAGEYRVIVKDLDRLSDLLCRVLDLSDFVRMTHPDLRFQQAAAEAWSLVYQYMNQLNTMTGLSDQLAKAMGNREATETWSEEERTVAQILKLDFSKSAVNLPKESRDKFVDLSQRISEVGSTFVTEMAPAKREVVLPAFLFQGLDPGITKSLTTRGDVRLPTLGSASAAALKSVHDGDTRKEIYLATRTASPRTIRLLETMLKLRAELAELAGFESFAHLALKDRMMAKSPGSVMQFLLALQQNNAPLVRKELDQMLQRKQGLLKTTSTDLYPWDREYLTENIRYEMRSRTKYPDTLSAYFSVGTVIQGLSRLFTRLYGIRFVPRETLPGETWHSDVRRLDVMADTGELIAVLYCDLFYRNDKSPNPAHFTVRCSREISQGEVEEAQIDLETMPNPAKFESAEQAANDGMESSRSNGVLKQIPAIALVCDFPKNHSWTKTPALLSYSQVETLFHEMGHAIHSILARTSLQNVAGTRCATDFAELPSTLMEHFAANPAVLGLFARHWETDEALPAEMVAERIRVAKRFEGIDTEHQILLAMMDQAFHSPSVRDVSFSSTKVYHDLQETYSQAPKDPPETCWQGFFGHLHGYGSTYYSYLFDRVLAERVWRVVFSGGQGEAAINRANGERLKENLLKWGGSRDPWRCLSDTLQDERLARGDERAMALVGSWGIKDNHHV